MNIVERLNELLFDFSQGLCDRRQGGAEGIRRGREGMNSTVRDFAMTIPATQVSLLEAAGRDFGNVPFVTTDAIFLDHGNRGFGQRHRLRLDSQGENRGMSQTVVGLVRIPSGQGRLRDVTIVACHVASVGTVLP